MLPPLQRDQVEIVLVSPRNPLNIGAVARAMANFGFSRLTVVAAFEPHWREAKSAVGAPELLANARECASLAEALAGCTFIAGTGTLAHRKPEQPVIALPTLVPLLLREQDRGGRIGLVFGPEKHGLTRHDLAFCHILVEIPTDPRQPSMNLGQAVAVCLYELARPGESTGAADLGAETRAPNPPPVTSAQLDRLAELIEETMIAARYSPRSMQQANHHHLRLLLRRLNFSPLDVRRILGLFRRILWRLNQKDSGPD